MNRRLILDTETTGLDFDKDRIIEVACLELIDDVFSGEKFHNYYSPENIIISKQSEEIHGLSNDFLKKYKSFESEIQSFLEFIGDSQLIIHNAQFDPAFDKAAERSETILAGRIEMFKRRERAKGRKA